MSFILAAISGAFWLWSSYLWIVASRLKSPYTYVGHSGTRMSSSKETGANFVQGIAYDPVEVTNYFKAQTWLNTWASGVSAAAAIATFGATLAPTLGW